MKEKKKKRKKLDGETDPKDCEKPRRKKLKLKDKEGKEKGTYII